jgi:PKD repeat protein
MNIYFVNPGSGSPSPPYGTYSTGAHNFHDLFNFFTPSDGDVIEVVAGSPIIDDSSPLPYIHSVITIRSWVGNGATNKPVVRLFPAIPSMTFGSGLTLYNIKFTCTDVNSFAHIQVSQPSHEVMIYGCEFNNVNMHILEDVFAPNFYLLNNIFVNPITPFLISTGWGCFQILAPTGAIPKPNAYISNNVFYQGLTGLSLYGDYHNLEIVNNVFDSQNGSCIVTNISAIFSSLVDYNVTHAWGVNEYYDVDVAPTHGAHNQSGVDPLFTDPPTDDFTLQIGSPCIDAGVGNQTEDITPGLPFVPVVDFNNKLRPFNVHTDIGAHEYGATVTSTVQLPTAFFTYTINHSTNTVTFNSSLSDGPPTTWLWDFGDFSSPSALQNPVHVYSPSLSIVPLVTLTASNSMGSLSTSIVIFINPGPSNIYSKTIVLFKGTGTVQINGDFIVKTGTCDTNGLNVQVGT